MKNYHLQINWMPTHCFIGAEWMRGDNCFDIWICLLPCISIHISRWNKRLGMSSSLDPNDNIRDKS